APVGTCAGGEEQCWSLPPPTCWASTPAHLQAAVLADLRGEPFQCLGLLVIVELGLPTEPPARRLAAALPSLARFAIPALSSCAIADRKASRPLPMVLVRSRCGLANTFTNAAAGEHAVDDRDPVHHRPGRAVPLTGLTLPADSAASHVAAGLAG